MEGFCKLFTFYFLYLIFSLMFLVFYLYRQSQKELYATGTANTYPFLARKIYGYTPNTVRCAAVGP